MAINERLIHTAAEAAGTGNQEEGLILHLDANDVDSYDGDGTVWYDISEHDVTIPLSDNADDLELHLNASDSTSVSGSSWVDISDNTRTVTSGSGIAAADFDKDNGGYWDLTQSTSEYFSVPHHDDLHPTDTGGNTFEFWVYPNGGNDTQIFAQKQSSGAFDYYMNLHDELGWELRLYVGGTQSICRHNADKTKGKWYHVVFTISSNVNPTVKLYLNGELKTTSNFTGTVDSNSSRPIEFGRYSTGNANDFNGRYGCVRYYSKALSASDIGQNYRHGRDYIYTDLIPDTDLELHLDAASFPQFGESGYSNTPSTWTDSSGNSNNGTITGATFDSELGNWLDFDGVNDKVTTSYDIPSAGAKTIEFWFNDNGSAGTESTFPSPIGGSNVAIWTGGNLTGSYSDESLGFYNADTGLHFYIRTGTNTYRDNKWHHVAITDNGSNQHAVYVDGTSHAISYLSGSSSSRISMDNVQIGKGQSTPTTGLYSYYFHGQVGQIRVYSSALTQDEVRQNFNFTKSSYPNGYNATGTNIDSTDWSSNGYFDFNGTNEYFSLGSDFRTAFDKPYRSISMWFKWDGKSTGYGMPFYMTGAGLNNGRTVGQINHSNGSLDVFVGDAGSYPNATVTANTWHHFVIVVSGSSYEAFLDKVSMGSATNNNYTSTGTATSIIGSYLGTDYYFSGEISKFKAYDKALNTAEITALYNEGE